MTETLERPAAGAPSAPDRAETSLLIFGGDLTDRDI